MKKPSFPDNESERVNTLHALGILDTQQEERFDNITRLAQNFFNVAIAVVSLVDTNRQWFKSCLGLSASETSRDVSFCGHAILDDGAFVINDALEDDRFRDNPLVVEAPKIRFYAGYPIKAPNGHKLGTLCIIDQSPREFSQQDITLLADLASLVEREIAITDLALLDDLTQISNRRGFMILAEHELSRCKREKLQASLLFFDLNKFKFINDTYGHAEGDKALISFVAFVKEALRESDIFGRIGGDEFALLLSNITEQQTQDLITRCYKLISEMSQHNNKDYQLSFSYGMVKIAPDSDYSIESVLLEADALMYKNK